MSQAMKHYYRWASEIRREFLAIGLSLFGLIQFCHAADLTPSSNNTNILTPSSPPANEITHLALFVFCITGAIFIVAAGLLLFVVIRFRARRNDGASEPPQVYGGNQVELAWTVILVLIAVVLFRATARVIFAIQDAPKPQSALDVVVVRHQFWSEFRYPKLGIVNMLWEDPCPYQHRN
jgi:cytochrome c oxidase subunit 2